MGRFFTAYAAATGPMTAFPKSQALPPEQITDGKSTIILFGEASGLNIVWTEPRDIDTARLPVGINLPGCRRGDSHGTLSSYHRGGANVVFADGRVKYLSEQIDPSVLKALLTATGGEAVDDSRF
jgi:prepilin-type processing-associated H-X9-DG protein